MATPTGDDREKGDGTTFTWHDYAMKVYDTVVKRHRNAKMFILVNDCYNEEILNIKDGEHANRASKFIGGVSQNIFPASSKPFITAKEFQSFFRNKGNKKRLQIFLRQEFAERARHESFEMLYCIQNESYDISKTPWAERTEFANSHIEADTAVFFVLHKLRQLGCTIPVVIDSEDTDVVALSAYAGLKDIGDLAIRRKKGIFDCKKLCNPEMAEIVVRLHVMTGCDSVSSFFGIGKKTVWKILFLLRRLESYLQISVMRH